MRLGETRFAFTEPRNIDNLGVMILRYCGDTLHVVGKTRDFSSREHTSVGGWALEVENNAMRCIGEGEIGRAPLVWDEESAIEDGENAAQRTGRAPMRAKRPCMSTCDSQQAKNFTSVLGTDKLHSEPEGGPVVRRGQRSCCGGKRHA